MKYCKVFVCIIIFLTLSGCRKESAVLNALDNKVQNEITAFLQNQLSLSREDDKLKIRATVESLDYENMFVLTDKKFNKLIFVQMDTSFVGIVRAINDSKKAYAVFNMNAEWKILNAYILEVVAKNSDFTNLIDLLAAQKNNFSGKAVISSLAQHFVEERLYEDGVLKSKGVKSKRASNNQVQTIGSNGCTDWYLVTTWYYSDGSVAYRTEVYLYTTCGDCQTASINRINYNVVVDCGGGIGGEINQYNPLDIWLKVQDTCLRKIIMKIIDPITIPYSSPMPKLLGELRNDFFTKFGSLQSYGIQANYFDKDIIFINDYGLNVPARYSSSGGSNYTWMYSAPDTIKVNPNHGDFPADVSKEYITSVLLHEMTHAVITRMGYYDFPTQHYAIARAHTDFISDAIIKIFPQVPLAEARSMALGGLGGLVTQSVIFDNLLTAYGFTRNKNSESFWGYASLQYQNGSKGKKKCD